MHPSMHRNERGSFVYYTCDRLPVRHAFTTKFGGVSCGDCESLNLGFNRGDERENVLENYRILAEQLGMDEGESVMGMVLPGDYSGYMVFFFENGKAAKVELSAYKTTSNRRRLTGAYSDKSPLKALLHLKEDREIAVYSTEPRVLIVNTALLGVKTTRTTQGVALLTLKKKYVLPTRCASRRRRASPTLPATAAAAFLRRARCSRRRTATTSSSR